MRACLAVICLTALFCVTSAVEAQRLPLRYVHGNIGLIGFADSSRESSDEDVTRSEDSSTSIFDFVNARSTERSLPGSITFSSLSRPEVQLLPELRVPDPCTEIDTVLAIRNNLLVPLTVRSLGFNENPGATPNGQSPDPSSANHFTLGSIRLPFVLEPGASLRIPFHFSARSAGSFYSNAELGIETDEAVFDTTITLGATVERDFPFQYVMRTDTTEFAPMSACETKAFSIQISNPLCRKLTLSSIKWIGDSTSFLIKSAPRLPYLIDPGMTIMSSLSFNPAFAGKHSAALEMRFSYEGKDHDTVIQYAATATTNLDAHLTRKSLAFDTLTECQTKELTTYFRNESCDSIELKSIFIPSDSGFLLLEPPHSIWVGKETSTPITVLFTPPHAGAIKADALVCFDSREGQQDTIRLPLSAFVIGAKRDALFPASFVLDSLKPCSTFDTVLQIVNRGVCDTLRIEPFALEGSEWFMMSHSNTQATMLLPGDTLGLPIAIALYPEGSAHASIRIRGNGFDSTITMSVSVHSGGRSIVFEAPDTVIRAKLCSTSITTFYLSNPGCADVRIDSFYIMGGMPDQTQFHLLTQLPQPTVLKAGMRIPVRLFYDADGNGDGTATLSIRSAQLDYARDVHLTTESVGKKLVTRLGLLAGSVSQDKITKGGQNVTVAIVGLDDIPDSIRLTSLSVSLRFDDAVLTVRSVTPLNGWSSEVLSDTNGIVRLRLHRLPGRPIEGGTQFANVAFLTTPNDTSYSNVTIDDMRFNPEDASFERCIMAAVNADDTVRVDLSMFAMDTANHGMNGEQPSIRSMAVYPNAIASRPGKISMAEVDFTIAEEGPARINLYDDIGRLVSVLLDGNLYAGKHYVPIALPLNANGNYFVSIESGGFKDVRKIIIRN